MVNDVHQSPFTIYHLHSFFVTIQLTTHILILLSYLGEGLGERAFSRGKVTHPSPSLCFVGRGAQRILLNNYSFSPQKEQF